MPSSTNRAGFTLIELVVTLAILGVLASLAIPTAQVAVQRTKEQELRIALREIRLALDDYKKAVDAGRVRAGITTSGYPPDLLVLVEGVEDASSPKRAKIYFLRRLPRDPMHPDPTVPAEATWAKRSYGSEPQDPREGNDVYDVLSKSARLGLNGVPYAAW
jgi:general secretion pathway protein G